MIVRSITLAHWRCFLEQVCVGPFHDGLNVIHAPNGTGKSSLFEAMRRALLDSHRVTGKDVEAVRPWGRDLAPRVTVEFVHEGIEYRITKQFIDHPHAVLERKEDGRYRPLAEGAGADEQARTLLTRNPPGRGLARIENWGLAQILWAPQGNLALTALSDDLVTNVRTMLSAQVSGEESGPIEREIERRYLEFFSPSGKLRAGKDAPRLVGLEKALEEARAALQDARRLYQDFEDTSRRVEDLRARRAHTQRYAEETAAALAAARQRAADYQKLLAEKERRAHEVKTSEIRYAQLEERIGLIRHAERELLAVRDQIAALEAEVPSKKREAQVRAKEAEKAKAALEDARRDRKAVDEAERAAEEARRFVEATGAVTEADRLLARIRAAQHAFAEQQKRRSELVAPDARTLRTVRSLLKERDDARVRLEAALITLEIAPERDGRVEVVAGEQPGTLPLAAGVPTLIQGSPEVVAVIPGLARLRAWGPAGSVEEHRRALAAAEEKVAKLTAPFGSSSIEVLEGLAEKARAIEEAMAEAKTQVQTLLAGHAVEDVVADRARHAATLAAVREAHPEWDKAPPAPSELRARAEEAKHRFVALVDEAEAQRDKAQSALVAAIGEEDALAARIRTERTAELSLKARLAEYTADGRLMEDREAELGRLAMEWDAAKACLAEAERALEAYPDDPVTVMQTLERQLENARDADRQARDNEIREEARLESLSARGAYTLMGEAEEKVTRLEDEARGQRLLMDAIRLLRETVVQCRADVIAVVTAPVEAAATRILHRIASRRLGSIRLGEAFQPCAVLPDPAGDAVEMENISGGEQEQLYLATRLALAEVLAREQRQLVVLDDVLTATDAGRLARVMTVLEEAAQRLQLLILTCHPERYRGLKEAWFFDLEAMRRDAG